MTIARQIGLATAIAVPLGISAVYCAGALWPGDGTAWTGGAGVVVPPLLGLLSVAVVLVLWRNMRAAMGGLSAQLRQMRETGQMKPVAAEGWAAIDEIVAPLNGLLNEAKGQIEQFRAESRDRRIQSRIADAEKHHAEAIIFSISEAVIVTNRYDELLLANEAAEKLLGFELASSLRKNIDSVFSDGTLVRLIRETRNHGRSYTRKVVEHSVDRKGAAKTFSITLSCVAQPNEEASGVVAVLHDVTREKEISRMKTDFVSNVSHELKTPLASIKAYIEMLIDGEAEDDNTRQEFYEIISSETDRLHRLIENILNISRIESGVVKVAREPISLTGVAKQVIDVAAPQAKLKNINLVDQLAPVYYQVEADRDMIYQAILNLVSNAIKYTPEGGTVTMTISADEKRGMAVCQVADTGMGIPPDALPHIFDKFYRVEANKKIAKGTGLGLTLVKHIIETVHDGRLSVTSEVGHSSTFSFELSLLT